MADENDSYLRILASVIQERAENLIKEIEAKCWANDIQYVADYRNQLNKRRAFYRKILPWFAFEPLTTEQTKRRIEKEMVSENISLRFRHWNYPSSYRCEDLALARKLLKAATDALKGHGIEEKMLITVDHWCRLATERPSVA